MSFTTMPADFIRFFSCHSTQPARPHKGFERLYLPLWCADKEPLAFRWRGASTLTAMEDALGYFLWRESVLVSSSPLSLLPFVNLPRPSCQEFF